MKRNHNRSDVSRIRWYFFVLFFILLTPTNYLGKTITSKNTSDNVNFKAYGAGEQAQNRNEDDTKKSDFQTRTGLSFTRVYIALILIASSILYVIILLFLNNQPLTRQCLLLYIYGDILVLALSWIWLLSVSDMVYNGCGICSGIEEHQAKMLPYASLPITLGLVMMLNAASCLKLLMAKWKILDPLFLEYGYDDDSVILKLRCFCCIFVISTTILLYKNDVVLPYSCRLQGHKTSFTSLPAGTVLVVVLHAVLLITAFLTHISAKLYENTNTTGRSFFCRNWFCLGHSDADLDNENIGDDNNSPNGPIILNRLRPVLRRLSFKTFLAPILLMITFVMITFVTIGSTGKNHNLTSIIRLMMITIAGVILPTFIICRNEHLKVYAKRKFVIFTHPMTGGFEMIVAFCNRRTATRVEPLP